LSGRGEDKDKQMTKKRCIFGGSYKFKSSGKGGKGIDHQEPRSGTLMDGRVWFGVILVITSKAWERKKGGRTRKGERTILWERGEFETYTKTSNNVEREGGVEKDGKILCP